MTFFHDWLGLDLDCKRMLDNETRMLAHHMRKMENRSIPILQPVVNEHRELLNEAWTQITATVHALGEVIVHFDTWLGYILHIAIGHQKRKADMKSARNKQVRKESEPICCSSGFIFFLLVYAFPLGLCISFGFCLILERMLF